VLLPETDPVLAGSLGDGDGRSSWDCKLARAADQNSRLFLPYSFVNAHVTSMPGYPAQYPANFCITIFSRLRLPSPVLDLRKRFLDSRLGSERLRRSWLQALHHPPIQLFLRY